MIAAVLLTSVVAGVTGYVVLIGGDGLPMYRFLVPILPLACLLAAVGAAGYLRRLRASAGAQAGLALAVVVLLVVSSRDARSGPAFQYVRQDMAEVAAWKHVGRWFAQHSAPSDWIAVVPAGAIPYLAQRRAIDMLGLNDAYIAHRKPADIGRGQAGHEKYDVDYVLRRKPSCIVIGVYGLSPDGALPVQPHYPVERALLAHPEFTRHYRFAQAHTPGGAFTYARRVAF